MPTMKTYTATLDKPTQAVPLIDPDAYGANVGAMVAKDAKEITKAKEEGEQQTALVSNAQIRAKYAKALDDAQTSGAPLAPIKEQMNQELAKVGENFVTQGGTASLDYHIARSNEMFDTQANRVEVTRAAETARLKGMQFVQSQSAVIASNPLYLDNALQDTDALVATLNVSPEKKALAAQEIKNQLNAAAAMATARIDPEQAKKDLEGGKWDLTPDQRRLGISQADAQIRAKRVDAEYQRALKQQDIHDRNEAAANKLTQGIIRGQVNDKMIGDDPDLTNETRRALVGFLAARTHELNNGTKLDDPETRLRLWMAVNAPEGDPHRIYTSQPILEAVGARKLSTTTANDLIARVANQKDENGRSFATRLQGHMIVLGRAMNANPEYQAQPELAAAIQMELVGQVEKKASEMRSGVDTKARSPDGLLDPDSTDYFFKPGILKATADAIKQRFVQRATLGQIVERDGMKWEFTGGNLGDPKSWKKLGPAGRVSGGRIQNPEPE